MKVPLKWLQEFVDVKASAEEVATRLTMGGLEVEGIEDSEIGRVLDVYITPNRGDCLSIVGVAREVSALFGIPLHSPSPPPSSENGQAALETSVVIEDAHACPRFAARLIHCVKIGASPYWMQAKLEAAGMRSVNNVVDATNYVMLEMGQPIHAYDFDKLSGKRIVVRMAKSGEKLKTLDGAERDLAPSMLVIADAEKPVSVAGIMGGAETEVSASTTSILIEAAHFNQLSVRRTSRALGLKSEASYRFERVVDPNGVRRAADRVCELLQGMKQPAAVEGVVDVYPHPVAPRPLSLRVKRCDEMLGMEIPSHMAADCLRALQFEVQTEETGAGDLLKTLVPTFRTDIVIEEDLIEEVGRIYGYENIPETLPIGGTSQGGDSPLGLLLSRIRQTLIACGMQEVLTHSLVPAHYFSSESDLKSSVPVRNALSSEIGALRNSLLPGLLDVAKNNGTRGNQDLALFESGRIWRCLEENRPVETLSVAGLLVGQINQTGWQRDEKPQIADFWMVRGIVETLIKILGAANVSIDTPGEGSADFSQFHPGRVALISISGEVIGVIGEAHPKFASEIGLKERACLFEIALDPLQRAIPVEGAKFQSLSRFQAVSRDLAPRVLESVTYASLESAIRTMGIANLERFRVTDVYRGAPIPEGVKSLTIAFEFRASDKTLCEGEISATMESLRRQLSEKCGATFP